MEERSGTDIPYISAHNPQVTNSIKRERMEERLKDQETLLLSQRWIQFFIEFFLFIKLFILMSFVL